MIFDIRPDDCWIDENNIHWFCKIIQTTDDDLPGMPDYMGARMVRYCDKTLRLLSREQFSRFHPKARLYLREGKHY